jgi:hypothetical protein
MTAGVVSLLYSKLGCTKGGKWAAMHARKFLHTTNLAAGHAGAHLLLFTLEQC